MKCISEYTSEEIKAITEEDGPKKKEVIEHVIRKLSQCKAFVLTAIKIIKRNERSARYAEDLIQDSLVQLFNNLFQQKYKGLSSIENYALGIVKNKLRNMNAKKQETLYPSVISDEKDEETPTYEPEPTTSVETDYVNNEREEILLAIINKLTGNCPKLLKLWAHGFSHREISEELGMSEDNSRRRLYKCREKVKKNIASHPSYMELLRD